MSRDRRMYLNDIVSSCEKIIRYTDGLEKDDFLADEKTWDAVIRNMEIIGEATKHLPADLQKAHPAVEWRQIAGFRDVLIHQYFGIDQDVVWDAARYDVPRLLETAERLRRDYPGDPSTEPDIHP